MIDEKRNERLWQACGFIEKEEAVVFWWHPQLDIGHLHDLDGGLPDPDYFTFPYYLLQFALPKVREKYGADFDEIASFLEDGKEVVAVRHFDGNYLVSETGEADTVNEAMFNAFEAVLLGPQNDQQAG